MRSLTKATHHDTREHNVRLVMRALAGLGPISRADIARRTDLTRTTVSDVVNQLAAAGLVQEIGRGPSSGGKAPILLQIPRDARQLIGIHVGEGEVRGAIVNLAGEISHRERLTLQGRDGDAPSSDWRSCWTGCWGPRPSHPWVSGSGPRVWSTPPPAWSAGRSTWTGATCAWRRACATGPGYRCMSRTTRRPPPWPSGPSGVTHRHEAWSSSRWATASAPASSSTTGSTRGTGPAPARSGTSRWPPMTCGVAAAVPAASRPSPACAPSRPACEPSGQAPGRPRVRDRPGRPAGR